MIFISTVCKDDSLRLIQSFHSSSVGPTTLTAIQVRSNFEVAGVVSFSKSVYPNLADRFTLRCSDVTLDFNDLGSRIDDAEQDERED